MDIERRTKVVTSTIATSYAISTDPIDMGPFVGGMIWTPATLEATTKIAFKTSAEKGGTYVPLYDATNTLVEITVSDTNARCYPLPDELFGAILFKLWTEAAGVDVAATAPRVFTLVLKG